MRVDMSLKKENEPSDLSSGSQSNYSMQIKTQKVLTDTNFAFVIFGVVEHDVIIVFQKFHQVGKDIFFCFVF